MKFNVNANKAHSTRSSVLEYTFYTFTFDSFLEWRQTNDV